MSRLRYALAGAGHRAQMYVGAIVGEHRERAELVAICEPNPVRAEIHARAVVDAGDPAPRIGGPDQLELRIREARADRVIVTARDDLHADLIARSVAAGAHV